MLTVTWCLLIIPTVLMWHNSLMWIGFMSVYAIIASHWACFEAAKATEAITELSEETSDG